MAIGDSWVGDADDLHRIEHGRAFQRGAAGDDQEPTFVRAEPSRTLGDVQIDRQRCSAKLARELSVTECRECMSDTRLLPESPTPTPTPTPTQVNTSDPWG